MPDPFDETDAVLARKLAAVAPPDDLRERLLALRRPPAAAEESRSALRWAQGIVAFAGAAAAALAILTFGPRPAAPLTAATDELAAFLSHQFPLALETSDLSQVRAWLARQNPAHPVLVPAALARERPLGCRELTWRDQRGSLACFSLGDGRLAHLAMFPSGAFPDAPGARPVVASAGAWTRAAWTRDGMTYLLFVPRGMDPVKEMLSLQRRADREQGSLAGAGRAPARESKALPVS